MQCDGDSGLFISVSGFGAAVPAAGGNAEFQSSESTKRDLCSQTRDDCISTLQTTFNLLGTQPSRS